MHKNHYLKKDRQGAMQQSLDLTLEKVMGIFTGTNFFQVFVLFSQFVPVSVRLHRRFDGLKGQA